MSTNTFPRWLVIFFAVIGLMVAGPVILGLAVGAIALAFGLLGVLLKAGAIVLVIWAMVMIFKGLFGSKPANKLPSSAITTVGNADLVDAETQFEREKRESLAQLDKELEIALAKKNEA